METKKPLKLVLNKSDYFDFDGSIHITKLNDGKLEISILCKNAVYKISEYSQITGFIISETVDIIDSGNFWHILKVTNKFPIGEIDKGTILEEQFTSDGSNYVISDNSLGISSIMEKLNDA